MSEPWTKEQERDIRREVAESWRWPILKGALATLDEARQERDTWKAEAEQRAQNAEHWRQRAEDAEARIQQWESVFGHLSRDPDEAGNLIYREQQAKYRESLQTEAKLRAAERRAEQAEARVKELEA